VDANILHDFSGCFYTYFLHCEMMDDKLIAEMILKNIQTASTMNLDMNDVLNEEQMEFLNHYATCYNYPPSLSFFLLLSMLSHFSQDSYYTHFSNQDHLPTQLYLWLLGPSGMSNQVMREEF